MKKTVTGIKKVLDDYFISHPEIILVYIFGSIAQGRSNKLSDIDIAILINKKMIQEKKYRYGYKAAIITDLIQLLKTNEVDLVILNEANPFLRHRVLYHGKLIHSKDEVIRINFQVDTIRKYNDVKYIYKIHSGANQ